MSEQLYYVAMRPARLSDTQIDHEIGRENIWVTII